jgi:hypothetical protein
MMSWDRRTLRSQHVALAPRLAKSYQMLLQDATLLLLHTAVAAAIHIAVHLTFLRISSKEVIRGNRINESLLFR